MRAVDAVPVGDWTPSALEIRVAEATTRAGSACYRTRLELGAAVELGPDDR